MNCEICGHSLRADNIIGLCQSNRKCKTAHYKRWKDRNPTKIREYQKRHYDKNHSKMIYRGARRRARENGIPFTITMDDLPKVPEYCPILGIKLVVHSGYPGQDSPSLDRKIPSLGYVPGNIWWISYRANAMKQDATKEELRRFADWIGTL
jgi:hypothetical protein